MTEDTLDDREYDVMAIPYLRVARLQEHPYENERYYCVMQRMVNTSGDFAGWKHVSKGYRHSTSAFAALGRLVQKHREKSYGYRKENER
jgi:hypothetical protein